MKQETRQVLWFTFRVIVTIALLVGIFSQLPVGEVWSLLKGVSWSLFFLGVVLSFPRRYLNALQMVAFTRAMGLSVTVWGIIRIQFMTTFYGFFVPGFLSSGLLGWYRISEIDRKPLSSFSSVVFNRIYETLMVCLSGLVFLAFSPVSEANYAAIVVLGVPTLGMVFLLVIARSPRLPAFTRWIGSFRFVPRKIVKLFEGLGESATLFSRIPRRTFVFLLVIAQVRFVLTVVTFYLFALALDLTVSFAVLGWVRAALNMIEMLPVSFQGIGVRDLSLIMMLRDFDIAGEGAVALSSLLLARGMIMGLIGGGFELEHIWKAHRRRASESS